MNKGIRPTNISNNHTIKTLLPMACDGVGPSQTCLNIMRGADRAGYDVQVFANRCRLSRPNVPMVVSIPPLFNCIPHGWIQNYASYHTEQQFLNSVQKGDIAYLWPAASLEAHRILHDKGIKIVLEGINTRMASAKKILDSAYEKFGAEACHGITDKRIYEEEEKYKYATSIFAPNQHVENALSGSPLQNSIIPASYGVDISKALPPREYQDKISLNFMFCGYACVRKGVHLLLDAWKSMPKCHKLFLVGNIEPVIAERYRDLLASEHVEVVGFVNDVNEWFSKADVFVFPSLEEGGPQVVYEAAMHGLPMVVSPMGAGRLGEIKDALICVDPYCKNKFLEALGLVADSVALRKKLGQKAYQVAPFYDWNLVGKRRAEALLKVLN